MNYKSKVRLFKSDFLERFTHVHPAIPLLFWIPVILVLMGRSVLVKEISFLHFMGYGALGLFVWSFVEYLLHRFVFHYEGKSAWSRRFIYMMHGLHHDDPIDPTRLVMPIAPALIYGVILYWLFSWVIPYESIDVFYSFFLVGYLMYDYTHFYVHHYQPKTAWGIYLKKHHMNHHFKDQNKQYGVSSPLWDLVFGTAK